MKRRTLAGIVAASAMFALAGCEGSDAGGEMPPFLRARFTTEMKTVLRDLQFAEEQAAVNEGRYMPLVELRGRYFDRPLREGLELTVSDVTESGYRAKIVHAPSGLSCRLEVSDGARGIPQCD